MTVPVYSMQLHDPVWGLCGVRVTNLNNAEMSPAAFTSLVSARSAEGNDAPIPYFVVNQTRTGPLQGYVRPSQFVSVA